MIAPIVVATLALASATAVRVGARRYRSARLRHRFVHAVPLARVDLRTVVDRVARTIDAQVRDPATRVERDLPAALEGVARSLRSGASIHQALGEAAGRASGPLADDLGGIRRRLEAGVTLDAALDRWAGDRETPGIRLAVAALGLSNRLGGSGARAVDRLARSLRDRQAVQRESTALATQARLSAAIIVAAPLAFGLLGLVVDGRTARFLVGTPLGLGCLVGAIVLDGTGLLWMRHLVRTVPR